jgi:mycothiol synthase
MKMTTLNRTKEIIRIPGAPEILGLTFRHYRGEEDYANILAVIEGCKDTDGIKQTETLDDIRCNYEHLVNCDPYQDMLFAEINAVPVGYSQVFWEELGDGTLIYDLFGHLFPKWRRRGIATAMLKWNEARLRQIAMEHPKDKDRFFQAWAADTEEGTRRLLESQCYEPIRYELNLVRDLSEPIPEIPIPEGLEVRPVKEEHIWSIVQAADEAFQDHWGYRPILKEEFEGWKASPNFRPELWKVAWDGDQIAGSVQNFYNPLENEEYNRMRGYTEGISTRRPWRRRGLASALIVQSMKMFKAMGMTETAHGVDANNTSGALNLYRKLGYKVEKQYTIYRKPFNVKD